MNVLIVEDEIAIREVMESYCLKEGWKVQTAGNGMEVLSKFQMFRFDMILLDLMIPSLPGEEVCRSIRKTSNVPIIMVTSKALESDTINGLNMGADDYITKPFKVKEVIARMYALHRRIEAFSAKSSIRPFLCFNKRRMLINCESKEVIVEGKPANLTHTEFKILETMVRNPGKVYSRHDLSYEVQGYRYIGDGRSADAHIKNIRRKIETDPKTPQYIVTKIGAGYKFNFYPDMDLYEEA